MCYTLLMAHIPPLVSGLALRKDRARKS
jgi:hypothetical protein